jgi:hypothetical protein
MKSLDDYKADREANIVLQRYGEGSIEYCKNTIQDLAEILNKNGISPFDCTKEMKKKLQNKVSADVLKSVLKVNDQLIHWAKILNILKKRKGN